MGFTNNLMTNMNTFIVFLHEIGVAIICMHLIQAHSLRTIPSYSEI